jgi:hypothetical protein
MVNRTTRPQHRHSVVVAALAAGRAQAVEEFLVGHGVEEVADGNEGRVVLQLPPGEERLRRVDRQGAPPWRKEAIYSASERPPRGGLG